MLSDWLPAIDRPTRILLFLDGVPARRRALDPTYKLRDPSEPSFPGHKVTPIKLIDGFEAQTPIDLVSHILQLLGVDTFYSPTEEADDLIASYVHQRQDQVHVIISSDKDFYQIISDSVIIYRPGVKGERFYDAERAEEHMYELYKTRVPPSGIRMFKSLTGDPSDGIIGVPRLRKKIAAPLCSLPDVDAVYATGLPGFSKAEKEKAEFLRERVKLNFELAGLYKDLQLNPLRQHLNPDFDTAFRILREDLQIYGIDSQSFRVANSSHIRIGPPVPMQMNIPGLMPDGFLDDI